MTSQKSGADLSDSEVNVKLFFHFFHFFVQMTDFTERFFHHSRSFFSM